MKTPTLFFTLISLFFLAGNNTLAAKAIDVKSPNGEIQVSIDIKDKIYYSVSYDDDLIVKD